MKRSYRFFFIFALVRTLFYTFLYFNMYSSVGFISSFCQTAAMLSVFVFNFTLYIGVPLAFTVLLVLFRRKKKEAVEKSIKVKEEIVFISSLLLIWLSSFIQYETLLLGF